MTHSMKATGGWARNSAQYPRPNARRPSGDTSGACQRTARRPAARTVGVDLSRAMIGLAEAEEARRPLGVEYRLGDVRTLEVPEKFDLAFAAYLLNYAHSAEELAQMCRRWPAR